MSYRRFNIANGAGEAATPATGATLSADHAQTVAVVANVARGTVPFAVTTTPPTVADVAGVAAIDFEWAERAAILEYDEGLPRAEAERLAAEQIGNILPFRRDA